MQLYLVVTYLAQYEQQLEIPPGATSVTINYPDMKVVPQFTLAPSVEQAIILILQQYPPEERALYRAVAAQVPQQIQGPGYCVSWQVEMTEPAPQSTILPTPPTA